MADLNEFSPTVLRVVLGVLFILPGFDKVMSLATTGDHMVAGMVGGVAVAWLLGLVELLCGLAVLLGWKTKFTVYPLIVVMLGAIFMAVIPAGGAMMLVNVLFHVLAIAALLSVSWTGPGAYAVEK